MKVRLDEVCNIYKGKTTITKAIPGEYPLVVTAENRASHNEYQFDCKAVCVPLVSATGHGHASIKRLHYQEGKFALGTILSAVIPKDESILDTRYLYIYLSYFKDSVIVPLMRGSANVSLTIKALGSAEIELPSIEKQKSIVELVTKIEKNKSEIDNKLEEQIKIVSLIRNEILSLAVKGKLVPQDESDEPASVLLERIKEEKNRLVKEKMIKKEKPLPEICEDEKPFEIPKSWEWTRLNQISNYIKAGGDKPKDFSTIKTGEYIIPVIANGKTNEGITGYTKVATENNMCITVSGRGTIGYSCIRKEPFCPIVRLIVINPSIYIDISYLNYSFNHFIEGGTGTSIQQLTVPMIKPKVIPIPPLNEQKRIVAEVDKLMKLCNELELKIEKSKKYNEQLMESILKDNLKA